MNRSRTARLAILTICGAALAACGKTPSEKDVVDSIVSWTGTGDLAAQAWLNHSTFDRYTRQTIEHSDEMLAAQSEQLRKSAPFHSPALDTAVTSIRHALTQMAGFIGANDAPDVRIHLDSLRAAKRTVLAVADSLAKQQ